MNGNISKEEIENIKLKLQKIKENKKLLEELSKEKHELQENYTKQKDELNNIIKVGNCNSINDQNIRIYTIQKKSNRKFTIREMEEAILKVLGQKELDKIKKTVEQLRNYRKQTAKTTQTVVIRPLGYSRKKRKDSGVSKKTEEEKVQTKINKQNRRKIARISSKIYD